MQKEIDRYLARLENKGRADSTLHVYRRVLEDFASKCDTDDVREVTEDHVEDWLIGYLNRSTNTRITYLGILSSFFTHLARRGALSRHPVEDFGGISVTARPKPTYYTPEQVARLLRAPKNPEHRALLTLLVRHGQRISSVICLRWSDVNFENAIITYPPVKGHADPMPLPMDRDTAVMLKALRALSSSDWLFPGRKQNHVSYSPMRWMVQSACKAAGVPYRGIHELRRTCVSTLLHQGYPLHQVSKVIAGHASVTTTAKYYAGVDNDDVPAMIRGLPY